MTFDTYNSATGQVRRGLSVADLGVQNSQLVNDLEELPIGGSLIFCVDFASPLQVGGLEIVVHSGIDIITRRS